MDLSQKMFGAFAVLWGGEAGYAFAEGKWVWFAAAVVFSALNCLAVMVSE